MAKEKNLILVGVISAAHGIKGDVLVKSYTDPVSNIVELQLIDKNNSPVKLKMLRVNSKGWVICRLTNCNDRNHAEELKGIELYCYKENLPTLLTEEFYFEDLRGLKVIDKAGQTLGIILDVANYGAGDIIEIKFSDDGREEMFPFTKELFPTIEKDYVVLASLDFRIK